MSRWTGVITVVASVALLAGCGAGEDEGGAATSSASASSDAATPSLALTAPAATGGRCMPPNVENLQMQDTAFEGTVTEIVDGTVTLQVSEMYLGPETQTVAVTAPSQDLSRLLSVVDFQQGGTYLVSSRNGQVSLCGLSGPKDGLLAGLYDEAYAD